MAHPLPSEYTFGKVIGRAIHAVADSAADEDHLPEARAAVGRVRFTPKTSIRKAVADYSAFVLKATVHADLDSLGRIVDAEGRLGIWLVTGTYTVAWEVDGSIPPFEIEVTDAHTDENPLDLVTAAPPQPGPGITLQTLILPAGAAPGQVLGWTAEGLAWGAGREPGEVRIFGSQDAAAAYEAATGEPAYWIDTSVAPGEPDPGEPDPGATYNDFAYRWLGKDATIDGWVDTVAGFTLEHTANVSGSVSVSGDAAIFEHTNDHYGPYFTGELPAVTSEHTTELWVQRTSTSSTAWLRGLGGNATRGLMSPGGGGLGITPWMDGNEAGIPDIPLDQDWHVTVVRWSPGGTVITRDEAQSTAPMASAVPSPYVFEIGRVTGATNTKPYRGEIREVRVWNRRLSDDEVADVIAELRGVYGL